MMMTNRVKKRMKSKSSFEKQNNLISNEVFDVLEKRLRGKVSSEMIQAFLILCTPYALGYIKNPKNKSQFFLYAMRLLGTRMEKEEKACATLLFTSLGKGGIEHFTERFEELEKQEGMPDLITEIILNFDPTVLNTFNMHLKAAAN